MPDPEMESLHAQAVAYWREEMRRPERHRWERRSRVMRHPIFARRPSVPVAAPLSVDAGMPPVCETVLPDEPVPVIPCPCGQVIWEWSPPTGAQAPASVPLTPDPLPPLDDLDEGLTCCGQVFATFAAYMGHQRQALGHLRG